MKTYAIETVDNAVKVASAGIKAGLVTFEDIYSAIRGEISNKKYAFSILKPLIETGELQIQEIILEKKASAVSDARIRIVYVDNKTQTRV